MKDRGDKLAEALLAYRGEKHEKRRERGAFISLLAIAGLGLSFAFFSFLLYDENTASGTLAAAREVFADLLEENEVLSVFLGLDETRPR